MTVFNATHLHARFPDEYRTRCVLADAAFSSVTRHAPDGTLKAVRDALGTMRGDFDVRVEHSDDNPDFWVRFAPDDDEERTITVDSFVLTDQETGEITYAGVTLASFMHLKSSPHLKGGGFPSLANARTNRFTGRCAMLACG